VFHVDDNPKNSVFFGAPLSELIDFYRIPADQLFDDADRSLWSAKLYELAGNAREVADSINFLIRFVGRTVGPGEIAKWLERPRSSLGFLNADTARILDWQAEIEDHIRVAAFVADMNEISLEKAKGHLGSGKPLYRQLSQINEVAKTSPLFLRVRLYKAISLLLGPGLTLDGRTPADFEDLCYSEMSRETIQASAAVDVNAGEPIEPLSDVLVEAPIRVNWAGGWSDTPPYCYEFGGTVLNAALALKGELPLKAVAKVLADRVIVFESIDTHHKQEFADLRQILDCRNPSDPFALHKAVLIVSGIVTKDAELTIAGGLYLGTSANVPRGSGLGTSSILAGACLQAVAKIRGRKFTINEISSQILCVEQLMSTGGGWQDQIGGLVSGIKLSFSRPGIVQTIAIEPLRMTDEAMAELKERFVLIYTGQQRLARNLLREVVGLVLVRDERSMDILLEIQRLAVSMKFELERGRITEFAKLLKHHWDLILELDPGTTTTCIDYIFKCCEDLIDGQFIAGAGGGGFLEVILKKGVKKEELAERLSALWQDSGVAIWDTEFV
jgi:fucokinase